MKTLIVVLTVVLGLLSVECFAKGGKKRANNSPVISAEEMFKKLDLNGDGKLTLAEYKDAKTDQNEAEKEFKAMDKDGDGAVTLEEFKNRPTPEKSSLPKSAKKKGGKKAKRGN